MGGHPVRCVEFLEDLGGGGGGGGGRVARAPGLLPPRPTTTTTTTSLTPSFSLSPPSPLSLSLSPSLPLSFVDVGGSSIQIDVPVSNLHWASLVISNTAVPVAAVEVKLDGAWQTLSRSSNNQWPLHGAWEAALPLPIRVTSVTGETVEDKVTGKVTKGTVQFTAEGDVKTGAGAPVPGWGTAPPGRAFAA